MNQLIGSFFNLLATIVNAFFELIIWIAQSLTSVSKIIRSILIPIFSIGCIGIFIFPIFLFTLNPAFIAFIVAVLIISILGTTAVSKLSYYQYISTEYLYDLANWYKSDKKAKRATDFRQEYERMQEENARKEREKKRKEEEEMWRKVFEDFFSGSGYYYKRGSGSSGSYGGYSGYGPGYGGQGGQAGGYTRSVGGFKEKYEDACDELGLDYSADQYDIKLAYRKMAKKYHPDLNHDPGATEKFQKINAAYEFLNEENIKRYASLVN